MLTHIRLTLRWMVHSPLAAGVTVASLGLALGVGVAIFSVFHALFLRPLPVENPEELVAIMGTDEKQGAVGRFMPLSRPNFEDLRDANSVFSGMVDVIFSEGNLALGTHEPEPVGVQLVPADFFRVLGVEPALGRFFRESEDEAPGRDPVAVLSHLLWERDFGSDPAVVGDTVHLNGRQITVIGIAPRGFTGTFVLGGADLWVPSSTYPIFMPGRSDRFEDRRSLITFAYGRLAAGVKIREAENQLRLLAHHLEREYPEHNEGRSVHLVPLAQAAFPAPLRASFLRSGAWMLEIVGLVLLIAVLNVVNLLLARFEGRRRDVAIRLCLGASRGNQMRQFLTESLVLTGIGGVLGVLLGWWGRQLLWSLRPPYLRDAYVDLRFGAVVLGLTTALVVLIGLVIGAIQALRSLQPQILGGLKTSGGHLIRRRLLLPWRDVLIAGQVALTFVAATGCGLFVRSLAASWQVDVGFRVRELALLRIVPVTLDDDAARTQHLFDQAVERARQTPGVRSATLATNHPLALGAFLRTVFIEGRPEDAANNGILTPVDSVGDDYFRTLGIPILQGRPLSSEDREEGALVAVINQAMADRYWPEEDALGKRFRLLGDDRMTQVVGVAADSKYFSIGEELQPYVYVPRRQHPESAFNLLIRSDENPAVALGAVRERVRSIDPNLALTDLRLMEDVVRDALWPARFGSVLLGALTGLALLLAMGGIFGSVRYWIELRRSEIGLRLALGARRAQVVRGMLRRMMLTVGVGMLVGAGLALFGHRMVEGVFYQIDATAVSPFIAAGVALGLASISSVLFSAIRIIQINLRSTLQTGLQ